MVFSCQHVSKRDPLESRARGTQLPSAILFNMNKKYRTSKSRATSLKEADAAAASPRLGCWFQPLQRTLSKLSRNQTWQPPITKQDDDKEKKSRCHATATEALSPWTTDKNQKPNNVMHVFFFRLLYLEQNLYMRSF